MSNLPSTDTVQMTVDLMFPSEYIRASDLQGKDVRLTIHRVGLQDLKKTDGTEVRKPVVEFKQWLSKPTNEQKKLVLNKTNAQAIASNHGNIANDWIGKDIVLYGTQCLAFGKMTDCIRVRTGGAVAQEEDPLADDKPYEGE